MNDHFYQVRYTPLLIRCMLVGIAITLATPLDLKGSYNQDPLSDPTFAQGHRLPLHLTPAQKIALQKRKQDLALDPSLRTIPTGPVSLRKVPPGPLTNEQLDMIIQNEALEASSQLNDGVSEADLDRIDNPKIPLNSEVDLPLPWQERFIDATNSAREFAHEKAEYIEDKLRNKSFTVEAPLFGSLDFAFKMDPTTGGIYLASRATPKPGKRSSPLYVSKMEIASQAQLQSLGKKLSSKGSIKFMGRPATIGLKKIDFRGDYNLAFIDKMTFELRFKEPYKTELHNGWKIEITGGYLVLQSWATYPMTLVARTTINGKKVRIMLLYNEGRVALAIRLKDMPLKSLIPAVGKIKPLQNLNIDNGKVTIDLWVPKTSDTDDEFDLSAVDMEQGRRMMIEAQLTKQQIELPDEEFPPDEEIKAGLSAQLTKDMTEGLAKTAPTPPTVKSTPSTPATTKPEEPTLPPPLPEVPSAQEILTNPTAPKDPAAFEGTGEITEEQLTKERDEQDSAEVPDELPVEEPISADEEAAALENQDVEIHDETLVDDEPIDEEALDESLPEEEPLDVDEPEPEPDPAQEAANLAIMGTSCLRDPNEPPQTSFDLTANIGRSGIDMYISAQELPIKKLGVLGSAQITLTIARSASEREDFEQRKYKLKDNKQQLTLGKTEGTLSIEAQCLPLKKIGVIEDVTLTLGITRAEKEEKTVKGDVFSVARGTASLTGTLRILANPIGVLRVNVAATLSRQGLFFVGTLGKRGVKRDAKTDQLTEGEDSLVKYAGLAITNVKLIYGYPPQNTADQIAYQKEREAIYKDRSKAATARSQARRVEQRSDEEQKELAQQKKYEELLKNKALTPSQKKTYTSIVEHSKKRLTEIRTAQQQQGPIGPLSAGPAPQRKKMLALVGTLNVYGVKLISTIALLPDPKNPLKKNALFTAQAVFKNIKPFKATKIPNLKEINLSSVTADISVGKTKNNVVRPSLSLGGKALLFGALINANVKFTSNRAGRTGVLIYTVPTKTPQPLSKLLPILKGKFFDNITCSKSSFILSSIDDVDTTFFTEEERRVLPMYGINRGVSFMAATPLTGTLAPVGKFLGLSATKEFRIGGNINLTSPNLSEFRIALMHKDLQTPVVAPPGQGRSFQQAQQAWDTKFVDTSISQFSKQTTVPAPQSMYGRPPKEEKPPKSPTIEFDGIEIYFKGDLIAPSLGVGASIIFRPTQSELLRFKGAFEFNPIVVTLVGQMLGTWNNPFGLKGWSLSNVGIVGGFIPVPPPVVVKYGGAAELIVKPDMYAKFKFITDMTNAAMGFEGNFSNYPLTFFDVVRLTLEALNVKLPSPLNFPMPIELKKVMMRYAPLSLKVGDQIIEQGFEIQGDIYLLGKKGHIEMRSDLSGMKALGTLDKVKLGNVLEITSADGKGDPKIDAELSFDRQKFVVTGKIKLIDLVEKEAELKADLHGFSFSFAEAIGKEVFEGKPLLMSQITGSSSGSFTNPQFSVTIDFQQNFTRYILKFIAENFQNAQQSIIKSINDAQHSINKINAISANATKKIDAARADVAQMRQTLDAIQQARKASDAKFETAKRTVNEIREEIRKLDAWYNALPAA